MLLKISDVLMNPNKSLNLFLRWSECALVSKTSIEKWKLADLANFADLGHNVILFLPSFRERQVTLWRAGEKLLKGNPYSARESASDSFKNGLIV